jgi:formylmethanofuran dehydrogenase subunit D
MCRSILPTRSRVARRHLQKTRDAAAPTARMSAQTLQALGVTDGAAVRVRQGSGEAVLTAKADETVPAGCVRVAAAHVRRRRWVTCSVRSTWSVHDG